MQFVETVIPDCFEILFKEHRDHRGSFVKTFQKSLFERANLEVDFTEFFYSISQERVLRGMHFQIPPADHAKLVYCVAGSVMDVTLDLRMGSPTFGQHATTELSAEKHNALYIPRGLAHGFYVRQAPAIMLYHVTAEYSSAHDTGIAWDSFGASWPDASPVMSLRDKALVPFSKFQTPFRYTPRLAGKP